MFGYSILFVICFSIINGSSPDEYKNDLHERYEGYGESWMYFPDGNNTPRVIYLTEPENNNESKKGKQDLITFHLFTRKNPKESITLEPSEMGRENEVDALTSVVMSDTFDPQKETKILIHGWMSGGNLSFARDTRDAYLQDRECNVIVVDWRPLSSNAFYPIPMRDTQVVGAKLARLIDSLVTHFGASTNRIHVIGHSLGAHVAGHAGAKLTMGKLARITGLDPALPGFRVFASPDRRLDPTDANFVDVIHTCGGVLGYWDPIGHADFYPNGGTPSQPGCCCGYAEVVEACSHGRAHEFFAESVISRDFVARRCDGWRAFLTGNCDSGRKAIMGDALTSDAHGAYYLITAPKKPYATGDSFDNEIHG